MYAVRFLTSTDKHARQRGLNNSYSNKFMLCFIFIFLFSALSVLCHGSPTPQNVVFLYKDGLPVEAKVGNISSNYFHFFLLKTIFFDEIKKHSYRGRPQEECGFPL